MADEKTLYEQLRENLAATGLTYDETAVRLRGWDEILDADGKPKGLAVTDGITIVAITGDEVPPPSGLPMVVADVSELDGEEETLAALHEAVREREFEMGYMNWDDAGEEYRVEAILSTEEDTGPDGRKVRYNVAMPVQVEAYPGVLVVSLRADVAPKVQIAG